MQQMFYLKNVIYFFVNMSACRSQCQVTMYE